MAIPVTQNGVWDAKLKCVTCRRAMMKQDAQRILYLVEEHSGDLQEMGPFCLGCARKKAETLPEAKIVKMEEE